MCVATEQTEHPTRSKPMADWTDHHPLFGPIHFIINPAAAAGRTERRWFRLFPYLPRHLPDNFTYSLTAYPGQAYRIARLAVQYGCKQIVVMGGDGTIQEVVNGLFHHGELIEPGVRLGILNSGTGQGLARSLGLPERFDEQLQLLQNGRVRPIDLASVTYPGKDGHLHRRLWVNECQIGLGGQVVQKLHGHTKRLGGFLAFGVTALSTAMRYPAHRMEIALDGFRQIQRPVLGIVIGNGALTGGGMHLTPLAQPDDSYLDVLLIHSQNFIARLRNFPKIYSGTHIDCRDFSYFRARKIEITGSGEVPIAADGEFLGSLPATVEILPGALPVMTPNKGDLS